MCCGYSLGLPHLLMATPQHILLSFVKTIEAVYLYSIPLFPIPPPPHTHAHPSPLLPPTPHSLPHIHSLNCLHWVIWITKEPMFFQANIKYLPGCMDAHSDRSLLEFLMLWLILFSFQIPAAEVHQVYI